MTHTMLHPSVIPHAVLRTFYNDHALVISHSEQFIDFLGTNSLYGVCSGPTNTEFSSIVMFLVRNFAVEAFHTKNEFNHWNSGSV